MRPILIAFSAAALVAASPAAFATHDARSISSKAPGHEMHVKHSKKGHHGASGYASGREMQGNGPNTSYQGGSGYAPGQTTGSSMRPGY